MFECFRHVLPYFKKAQSHELAEGPDDLYRGWDGPLHVIQGRCDNPLHRAFIESGELVCRNAFFYDCLLKK